MEPDKSYDLSEFMQELVPTQRSAGVFSKSATAERIHDVVGHETLTEPIVATFFWQIINYTEFYDFISKEYKINVPKGKVEQMVVSHGKNHYSLLLLVPGLKHDLHYLISANDLHPAEIEAAFFKWQRANQNALGRVERGFAAKKTVTENDIRYFRTQVSLINSVEPGFTDSILNNNLMNIVLSRAPEEELMNSFKSKTHHKVTSNIGENSTAGVYAIKLVNVGGQTKEIFGVTVCRHGLIGQLGLQPLVPNIIGQEVEIKGLKGKVISDDVISDSCFVELDQKLVNEIEPCTGPLQIFPNQNDQLSFEGFTTGRANTKAMAWDPELLTPEPLEQKTFRTPKVTNKGDSGAGIFDPNGKVLGFAFTKSKLGQQPEYSKWIWANSVFQFHNLKI